MIVLFKLLVNLREEADLAYSKSPFRICPESLRKNMNTLRIVVILPRFLACI
jgi:hypothetical protein